MKASHCWGCGWLFVWHLVIFFLHLFASSHQIAPKLILNFHHFLLSHPDLFFFWAEEINGSTFPVSGCKQPAYGCSAGVIAAECQLREHDTDMQSELKDKKTKSCHSFFFCMSTWFPIVHPHEAALNHHCPPNHQTRTHLIKLPLFIIRHLAGTLRYNNTLLLHNSCMVSLPLTSPSNYALKSTHARAAGWLVYIAGKKPH